MSHDTSLEFTRFAALTDTFLDPKSISVVLEIGSRDALVAIDMKKHFPNARIFAFECNPPAIELCRKNITDLDHIFLVDQAVSDMDGPVTFYAIDPVRTITPHEDGNIGASSLYQASAEYPLEKYVQNEIVVNSTTLETWMKKNNIDSVDIIWMDLQGAELKALRGMGSLLSDVKIVYTELEYKEIYINQPLAGEVRDYLKNHGLLLYKQMGNYEWFGNEFFCNISLIPAWKQIMKKITNKVFTRK